MTLVETTLEQPLQEETPRELTLRDRCDSCGAAARVIATFSTGELMFCGHHARLHDKVLESKAVHLVKPKDGKDW